MNRAPTALAEWNTRTATSPAALHHRRRDDEAAELRRRLRTSRDGQRKLQARLDSAATVITTLLAENAALREQIARRPATVVPISRAAAHHP
ncbi:MULTISPECIES: hypothetical protein [unclassified Kitasatospora]|uniref:hypothetical protein n=1 Tax=unclassified Kitasatospora TaxID=2633591 RepID=UPI0033E91544